MITAKEFWDDACKNDVLKSPSDIMIEYAKLAIKMDRVNLLEHVTCSDEGYFYENYIVNNSSIIDAPNIKLV
jgi:hypothetical protein